MKYEPESPVHRLNLAEIPHEGSERILQPELPHTVKMGITNRPQKGWRMVFWKSWVLANFRPISSRNLVFAFMHFLRLGFLCSSSRARIFKLGSQRLRESRIYHSLPLTDALLINFPRPKKEQAPLSTLLKYVKLLGILEGMQPCKYLSM